MTNKGKRECYTLSFLLIYFWFQIIFNNPILILIIKCIANL